MNIQSPAVDAKLYERLLVLLDRAYEAPFKPDNFHDMLTAAHAFYFADNPQEANPADAFVALENDLRLASHLSRIEFLLDGRELENRAIPANINRPALVSLLIDGQTLMVKGNGRAAAFFGHSFPCKIGQLNIDPAARETLSVLARKAARDSAFPAQMLILRRSDDAAGHIAKCGIWTELETTDTANPRGPSRGLAVSIAHIEWTQQNLSFCRTMFDLTDAETMVLAGLLKGQSQKDISEERGRSIETVKAQCKAILRKSGCSRISDLMVLATTYGLLVEPDGDAAAKPAATSQHFSRPDRFLALPDGRKLHYGIHGTADGALVLFIHGLIQGPFFPSPMTARFTALGLTVIAPSRPGFGLTDPPVHWRDFSRQVVADTVELMKLFGDRPVTIIAHQGGVSHALRIAHALGPRLRSMVMISAGVPIDEKRHLKAMGLQTRIAAMGVKYTPRLLETMIRIGIANELRRGLRPYLLHFFSNSPIDCGHLDDPSIFAICEAGVLHMIDQGPKAIIYDGQAAMADWGADFLRVTCPMHWIHGTKDPVMRHDFVEEYLAPYCHCTLTLIEDGANTMHLVHADAIINAIADAAGVTPDLLPR